MENAQIAIQDKIDKYVSSEDIVLYGVLNWGLGHATRSISLIHALNKSTKKVIIGSDGLALVYLKKVFPENEFFELPSYHINYGAKSFLITMVKLFPSIIFASFREYQLTKSLVKKHNISILISDNRLGMRASQIPNIYVTHQINIFHNNSLVSWIASKMHQFIIKKYTYCWVPDYEGENSLAGLLSENKCGLDTVYLGPLTNIKKISKPRKCDICVILSGPEPQRTILEKGLLNILSALNKYKIIFVRGTYTSLNPATPIGKIEIHDMQSSEEIENILNSSELLISRSGYSTLMDIYNLPIKAILIPTPGQTEQEYLASRMTKNPKYKTLSQDNILNLEEKIKELLAQHL